MQPVLSEISRLAGDALLILLHLAAALAHARDGNINSAVQGLSQIVENASPGRYVDEAQYWRGRIAEAQDEQQAKAAAIRDYVDLYKRLPNGPLKHEIAVRIASITQPGRLMSAEDAERATRRALVHIGQALHNYAADNGGKFPKALPDLLDRYVSDALLLVRPGSPEIGGGASYHYRGGLTADLRPDQDSENAKASSIQGIPVIVWEPNDSPDGTRLVLRIDGSVHRAVFPPKE